MVVIASSNLMVYQRPTTDNSFSWSKDIDLSFNYDLADCGLYLICNDQAAQRSIYNFKSGAEGSGVKSIEGVVGFTATSYLRLSDDSNIIIGVDQDI